MHPLNIIVKSFDGHPMDKVIIGRAFRDWKLGTCITIADHQDFIPEMNLQEHIWMPAGELRNGQYPNVDWNQITPLDEELIEKMCHCEGMFMTMITRYAEKREISYQERKRQYYDHLRYWNHTLLAKKIDFVLMNHPPHQCYDIVIYDLCKLKGIPLLYLERNHPVDALFLVKDWEESAGDLRDRLQELKKEYADESKPVPLSENGEAYFQFYREREPDPWYKTKKDDPGRHSFLDRWGRIGMSLLIHKPTYFFRSVISPAFWQRKLSQHRALRFYDTNTTDPDFEQPYIYAPLHYQPEATTSPQAGAYVDQELIIQILAKCLPPHIKIFVKEHPNQGELCRSTEFYQAMLDIPSVIFVPKAVDTYHLMDKSIAVVSAVGSVLFESMMRGKPGIMFGHFFYQYAPSVEHVQTVKECQQAVDKILKGEKTFTDRDIRLFLKGVEESSTQFAGPTFTPVEKYTQEEKMLMMGDFISKGMERIFGKP